MMPIAGHNDGSISNHHHHHQHHHHRTRRSWYRNRTLLNGFMLVVAVAWMVRIVYFGPVSIGTYDEILAEDPTMPLATTFTAQSNHSRDHIRNSGATTTSLGGIVEVEVEAKLEAKLEAKEVLGQNQSPKPHHLPRFMFVHIGKTGGSTLQFNIRALCVRNQVEHYLTTLTRAAKQAKKDRRPTRTPKRQKAALPELRAVICTSTLNQQSNLRNHNPPTEMKISTEKLVIGSIHMNMKSFWWNANDFGEAPGGNDLQTRISAILSRGDANVWNPEAYLTAEEGAVNVPPDSGMTDSTAFLVPVRDPIDRLVSAFNYNHPENHILRHNCTQLEKYRKHKLYALRAFYCYCFPTVHDLVDIYRTQSGVGKGNNNNNDNNNDNNNIDGNDNIDGGPVRRAPSYDTTTDEPTVSCLEIAQNALRGRSHYLPEEPGFEEDLARDLEILNRDPVIFIGHITMNYGYYYRRAMAKFPSKELVVVRTEHLWNDLQDLEQRLGGTAIVEGEATGHRSRTYGSHAFAEGSKITASDGDSLQVLCCAILSEAKIYIELIRRASNLSDAQKKESLDAFSTRCDLELCVR